jgi:PAS domain S-box-containing protein
MKIKTRLLSQMLSQTLFIMLITLGVTSYLTKGALETAATEKLTVMLEDRYSALNRWAETLHSEVTILAVSPTTTALLRQLSDEFHNLGANVQTALQHNYSSNEKAYLKNKNNALLASYDSVHQETVRFFMRRHDAYDWNDMYLVDVKGNVVFSLKHEADFATNLRTGVWKETGLAKAVLPLLDNPVAGQLSFSDFSKYEAKQMQPAGFIAMPVFDNEKHQLLGAVVIQLPITQINELVLDKTGMGDTGEVIIVGKDGWMLSDSRFREEATILKQQINTIPSRTVLAGEAKTMVALDYRGVEILASVKPFYPFQQFSNSQIIWGIIAKIEHSEVLSEYEHLQRILLAIATSLILLTILLSVWSGHAIAKPLIAISNALSQLAKGEKVNVPELQRSDEIGEIAKAAETFHVMTQQIEHEHWLHENVSLLTSMVSAENLIEQAANKVLHLLCNLLAIPVGAIYLQAEKGIYQRVTTHGLARSNQSEISFETGIGLLGQCVKSNQAIVLSPVPSGLTIISTGLAEFSPHELIIYPVPHKNDVLAVIELAATQSLTTNQHELLKAVSDALGLHFANLQAAEHNAQLLQETKAQAAKLSTSSHYARSLLEASLDPLVTISIDGMIMDVNAATEKVTGVKREALIGSDFCQYFTDPQEASNGYQQVFAQGFVTDYPLALRHVCGKITDVIYNASLYYDVNGDVAGIFAAARDVTDKKIAEQKMLEQQEALQHSNVELQALTEELRGQSEEMRSQNEELRSNQEELRAQQEETLLKNQLLETQSKQLEAFIAESKAKAEELKRSNQYKSEFLANMSHELRTPLNSILILSKSLAENDEHNLSDDQIESANVISESGTQLLTLINDILDLSKIEAGKLELSREMFPINDMVTYLRRVFLPQSERKKLDFEIEIASDVPETIYTDKQRLTQVLTNLLTNAIKFTDLGGVKITFNKVGDNLKIAVTDTGIGIPAEKLEHIFGAFQQLDGSTSRKYGGSGLGLAISRNLAQLLGGEISVTSTIGEGSQFVIELINLFAHVSQRASDKKATVSPAPVTKIVAATASKEFTQDKNILLIEDDTRLLAILGRMITALGFKPISVESAEKSLEELEKNQITGIFLDLGLPKMSGMELLKHLKANPKTADIPVFIMSGAEDTGQAKTLGALGFLKKPVTRDTIIESLKTMVQHSKHETQALLTSKREPETVSEILLIEDNPVDIKNVLKLLSDKTLKLTAVETGGAALEQLKKQHFDMVILDLKLPDMSGFEWLEKAKLQGELPGVVVYSARELTENEVFELKGVTESIVTKNALNERLREEVLYLLKHPHTHSPALLDSLTGKKILLVDDDARNLFALTKVLKAKGFAIEVAPDGLKALELLQQTAFDILLTDIMMPDVDGYELIRRVRALGYDKLPIIAITAKAMKGDDSLCLDAGANNYLTKPVDVNALIEMIHELL